MIRVELCGPLGAGKTALVKRLQSDSRQVALESYAQNPFWPSARETHEWFFSDLAFLLQHALLFDDAKKRRVEILVCDFSLVSDMAYARVRNGAQDLAAYRSVFDRIVAKYGYPSLCVHLDVEPPDAFAGVRRRARRFESNVSLAEMTDYSRAIREEIALVAQQCLFPIITVKREELSEVEHVVRASIAAL